MYFCRKRGCNTKSMLMEIVACQLCICVSVILCAASEMLQLIHSPLCIHRLPWHTSFTIILITKSAPAIHAEKKGHIHQNPLQRQQPAFQKHSCQLTGCHVCVTFFPQPLDMLKHGTHALSSKRTSNQSLDG